MPVTVPGDTRSAGKGRLSDGGWRITVLRPADLADLAELTLAETRGVDDRSAWLDDATVAYGLPHDGTGADAWARTSGPCPPAAAAGPPWPCSPVTRESPAVPR
ncbi:hypothetical protein J5Y04_13390 [Kitasatospora sp. RG8]|uniref:hypothetical protein n=1 Tax=Kitasatospora sp. RG8 TaxID=2820815 RepID=UPI001ADEF062|nr:hypothetical protein [Kitasatospora sp. RG8]MBP0450535.1 hypothetical protein [Kitasatospora sp. RG8]